MSWSLAHPMAPADGFRALDELGQLAQLRRTPRIGLGGFDDESATPEDFGIHGPFGVRVRVRVTGAAAEGFHLRSVRLRVAPRQCDRPPD